MTNLWIFDILHLETVFLQHLHRTTKAPFIFSFRIQNIIAIPEHVEDMGLVLDTRIELPWFPLLALKGRQTTTKNKTATRFGQIQCNQGCKPCANAETPH